MHRLMTCAVFVLAASTAFAQDVKTDFDKGADFSKVKTFDVKIGTSWNNTISEDRIRTAVEKAIAAKGWTKVSASADAMVVLHGATDVKKELNTFYSDMGGYGGYGWHGWGGMGMGSSTTTVNEFTVGTLVVDIFDEHNKKLLFRGTASDEISTKPDKNIKKIDKATKKMFKNFPPAPAEAKK
jgi:hypothetical protein